MGVRSVVCSCHGRSGGLFAIFILQEVFAVSDKHPRGIYVQMGQFRM